MKRVPFAIVCPCGPLWKWGYENTAALCLANQAQAADALYLVHSVKQAVVATANAVELSSPETWFHPSGEAPDDTPFASYAATQFTGLHERNYRLGRMRAWQDGYRIVVYTQSNWYIPESQREPLRRAVARIVADGQEYGLLNRRHQFGRMILRPDKAAYLIINMTAWDERTVLLVEHDRKLRGHQVGNHPYVVDCGSEQTAQQLSAYFWRARYERRTPEELTEYTRRAARKAMPGEPVADATGLAIAAKSRPEYLSRVALS